MDYEYEREGVVNLFLCCEPLAGQRWVDVTAQRTRRDWAQQIQQLVDRCYPDAERIVLVMDHLNTHTPGAFYDAFAPAEAKRLADKLEIHHTPKHGSWLNIAAIRASASSAARCVRTTSLCAPFAKPERIHVSPASRWTSRLGTRRQ